MPYFLAKISKNLRFKKHAFPAYFFVTPQGVEP